MKALYWADRKVLEGVEFERTERLSVRLIPNQLVNRQKKVTSLVELKLTPGQLFN
jgi:hypothetical protein